MKHKINPIVDCVFKALLGSEKNKNLLIHFLNAVTGLKDDDEITDVVIMNPYNDREFIEDKLSVVDIKAKCQNDFKYQIEIQLAVYSALPSRIIYNWSTIYHSQITKKGAYSELKPVFSIWILDSPLFKEADSYHLAFGIHDLNNNISLSNHLKIHLLQLSLFDEYKDICNETERWLYFLKQAEHQDINNLPEVLQTKEMIQAMETLQDFSENQKNYLLYQSRIDAQIERNTWELMVREAQQQLKEADKQRQEALIQLDAERQEKEKEKREKEQYLKLLKQKGIDIDSISLDEEQPAYKKSQKLTYKKS
ncbi:MAG: Rpn family recombination-promoting nuclease/putative transposase [Desulfamplus sp.]|nr:Rpn family recombination-promoting nuclease/putative transposase [Desulfamplus sp.]